MGKAKAKTKTKLKMKTNRGAVKRFKKIAGGRYKFKRAFKNHILSKMSTKRKRQLRGLNVVDQADTKMVARMLNDK